jgi:SAM-dependent methyltransferase
VTDPETVRVYGRQAAAYADLSAEDHMARDRAALLEALPPGDGPVLDWGCGPGQEAARFAAAGVACEATDASAEMVARAIERGVAARCEPFEALPAIPVYRGIWASFSLLHAAPEALPTLIRRAGEALLPRGVLHLAMKRGQGTARDRLGRLYTYVEAADLDRMTAAAGLSRLALRHGEGRGLDGSLAGFVVHLSRKADG